MAAAENLQRAQQEIRKAQTNRHSRITSPLRQVFKDEKNERKENQHLGRNNSGRNRTPLNLDVAQAFQPSVQHNPNQPTWQALSKRSIGSLGQIGQSAEVSGFQKCLTMPSSELRRHLQQVSQERAAKDFVF